MLTEWIQSHNELSRRFRNAERIGRVRTTGPFASQARRAYAPGAALVGDAADFFDPFTGEGIYAALRGGELLAPYALEAARSRNAANSLRALKAYESARHTVFSGKWKVERMIGLAVASPLLLNRAAQVLERDRDLADLLVGVAGDFVPPSALFKTSIVRRFVFPGFGHRVSPAFPVHDNRS